MDLTSLADFNAVALHGGFGPASRALDRPKATLSRRVAELEEDLGVRLIERGARRLRLTEEGLALHERTRGLMTEIQEAGEAVASRAPVPRGRLRISAPVVFAHVALCQIAARFALAYPQVELEVIAEDRVADPVEDGYDLVIRIDPPHDEQLVGRRILGDERLVVASPTMSIPSTPASEAGELEVPAVMSVAASSGVLWNMRTEGGGERNQADAGAADVIAVDGARGGAAGRGSGAPASLAGRTGCADGTARLLGGGGGLARGNIGRFIVRAVY